ncbi:MAG: bifunctional phosphopantothenoylcysteine decarboxylase/phosphopantothenate--cysteine ligase CoaBC [Filomicrobium sp.]
MKNKRVLLVISGGIAAYKCLELIRRLRDRGVQVRVVMTRAAQQFVTPLAVSALTNEKVFTDLFDLDDEREIGHIRLSRDADAILVAPATADLIAKMANGHADDLASSVLLATDKAPLVAPAMNPRMWMNKATQRNVKQLEADGVCFIGPGVGEMAERNEAGQGRLVEVPELIEALLQMPGMADGEHTLEGVSAVAGSNGLAGRHVLVTSGPTHEPIDPVRYIANRSSGKQGHAIAAAAAAAGASVTLISGPVNIADPEGVNVVHVETAAEMLDAVEDALPADVGVFCAAVADWRVASQGGQKIKKQKNAAPPRLELVPNPDILNTIAKRKKGRPQLVVGFAAETEKVLEHARAKLQSKGCDWIIANDVSTETGVMGGDRNQVNIVRQNGHVSWPDMSKDQVADALVRAIVSELDKPSDKPKKATTKSTGRTSRSKTARAKKPAKK